MGQVVYSKNGRDKGRCFMVVSCDDQFAYLVDGDLRKLAKPKKKKIKHVQMTHNMLAHLVKKTNEGISLLDSDVRTALLPFKR